MLDHDAVGPALVYQDLAPTLDRTVVSPALDLVQNVVPATEFQAVATALYFRAIMPTFDVLGALPMLDHEAVGPALVYQDLVPTLDHTVVLPAHDLVQNVVPAPEFQAVATLSTLEL